MGNRCYKGYCIDLIRRLSEDLDFTFELHESKDGRWGGYDNNTGQWDGLVRMLIEKVNTTPITYPDLPSITYLNFTKILIGLSAGFMSNCNLYHTLGDRYSSSSSLHQLFEREVYRFFCALHGGWIVICSQGRNT